MSDDAPKPNKLLQFAAGAGALILVGWIGKEILVSTLVAHRIIPAPIPSVVTNVPPPAPPVYAPQPAPPPQQQPRPQTQPRPQAQPPGQHRPQQGRPTHVTTEQVQGLNASNCPTYGGEWVVRQDGTAYCRKRVMIQR